MKKIDEWEEIGKTQCGITIWRSFNDLIGGYDYRSNNDGCGGIVVDSLVVLSELEIIIEDMKKRKKLKKQ